MKEFAKEFSTNNKQTNKQQRGRRRRRRQNQRHKAKVEWSQNTNANVRYSVLRSTFSSSIPFALWMVLMGLHWNVGHFFLSRLFLPPHKQQNNFETHSTRLFNDSACVILEVEQKKYYANQPVYIFIYTQCIHTYSSPTGGWIVNGDWVQTFLVAWHHICLKCAHRYGGWMHISNSIGIWPI